MIEQLLINRGISKKAWRDFIDQDYKSGLHDPFLFNDMLKIVDRIFMAVQKKEKIGIFADYDADGIPAAVLLTETLEKIGLMVETYIPSREEGYGLNKNGIEYLKGKGATILITVDLGIREIENTDFAKSIGMEVIITDHHEPGDDLPKALAIINPKLKGTRYPFRELSGGGVVFKLMQALAQKTHKISEACLKWSLDLVAITTICDVVPLVDENRIFAKYGLVVLSKTKRLGLKALYKISSIDPEKINTYTVGFQIGPRINAPGRLNEKQESFNLLKTKDETEANVIAKRLDAINRVRQDELEKILSEARQKIIDEQLTNKKVILLADQNWPSGLIGLVAGKLVEEFSRPCIVLEKGKTLSKGSARSIDNYNIVEVLDEVKDLLKNFGGHAKAAGLTIENSKLELLYDRLLTIADSKLKETDLIPKLYIDAKMVKEDVSLKNYSIVEKLEPFGLGNPKPNFVLENVMPESVRRIGLEGKHLKFRIDNIDVIGFNYGHLEKEIMSQPVDLAFQLEKNSWNNYTNIQIKIVDLRYSTLA